jgi:hypothetical protein
MRGLVVLCDRGQLVCVCVCGVEIFLAVLSPHVKNDYVGKDSATPSQLELRRLEGRRRQVHGGAIRGCRENLRRNFRRV